MTLMIAHNVFAQKPALTPADYDAWTSVNSPGISNDGRFAFYKVKNDPPGSETLTIKEIGKSWEIKIQGAGFVRFTKDSRYAICIKGKDSLCLIKLGNNNIEYLPNISSSNVQPNGHPVEDMNEWLVYQQNNEGKELVVKNLSTGTQHSFSGVSSYRLSPYENVLLLQVRTEKGIRLEWIDLPSNNTTAIWQGAQATNFIFDTRENQLVFISKSAKNDPDSNSIWYFKAGMQKAEILTLTQQNGIDDSFRPGNLLSFSGDGEKLFFTLQKKDTIVQPAADAPKVDVWSYNDPQLQSRQLIRRTTTTYEFAIDLSNRRLARLADENEQVMTRLGRSTDNYVIVMHKNKGDYGSEWNWNYTALVSVYLISTADGTRKLITPDCSSQIIKSYSISPSGNYVVYYDPAKQNYFSYHIASGVRRNLTQSITTKWTVRNRDDEPLSPYELMGYAGWLKEDQDILIYDQNDIYKVDPSGKRPAISLTNGYGRRKGIVFHLAIDRDTAIANSDTLLLSAFDRNTKEDGFFSVIAGETKAPKRLTLQPYLYESTAESDQFERTPPLKARYSNTYLLRRMSVEKSPNYFTTTDFKEYSPVTDIYPERRFNWVRSTLITWKIPDGTISHGILYKPENFDPKKKYPIIFYYYERLSEGLHGYIKPELDRGPMNIPYYVSNGYMVFVPDIHYSIGYPGRSAYRSIVSAALYLAKMPWVDGQKMGIQGHSFGGFETNYVVTHTGIFKAACSASGWADFINAYTAVRETGESHQYYYEMFRERMGATLWKRPDLYLENSPVLRADKLTTPLLMMNNKQDDDVSFAFGVEFFTSLRRLGKKAWMLQYDGEGHMLGDPIAAKDFTIRMKQFFDYYLKGAPIPKWMVDGIPANKKGIDLGYELKPINVTPRANLLINQK